MGIHCEINLHNPSGNFVGTAGNVVSGVIKYAVDEETIFNKIIVSLKGLGAFSMYAYFLNGHVGRRLLQNQENYIDIDHVIENSTPTTAGSHEIPFSFVIPNNVPPSVNYDKYGTQCRTTCCIKYYVRIKFNRRGIINTTKRYMKPITMRSSIIPRLPTTPTTYNGNKKLTNVLTLNSGNVTIKANILNSVLKYGDIIEFNYELINNSKLTINGVETKLVETHKFFVHPTKPVLTENDDIDGTNSKTSTIKSGETQNMSFTFNIPLNRTSVEFAKIYSREYFVFIVVHLPMPHKNYVLKIPVQIDDIIGNNFTASYVNNKENPPSYWECMEEYKSDKIELTEISNENEQESNQSISHHVKGQ